MINRRLGRVQPFLILIAIGLGLHVHADVSAPLPPEPAPGQPGAAPAAPAPPPPNAVMLPVRLQVPDANMKTSTSPDTARIDLFVQRSVERLVKGTDTTTVSDARNDLIAGSSSPSPQSPVLDPYLGHYTQTLAQSIAQEWAKATLNQRINFGITITRVAENAVDAKDAGSLAPLHKLIIKELQDPSPAIALWGMKAAAVVMNATPGAPSQDILNQVIPCVQKHAYAGPVTDEAYNALSDPNPQVIASLMQLYKERIGLYANGVPSEPAIEHKAAGHLVAGTGMWGNMTPQQQASAMSLIAQESRCCFEGGAVCRYAARDSQRA